MKTNYSLKRIEQLEMIILKLGYQKRNKHYLTIKEANLQNKIFICICSQKDKLILSAKSLYREDYHVEYAIRGK